jgi:hypothetical protein
MIILEHAATTIGIIGVAIIIWGVIKGLVALLLAEFRIFKKSKGKQKKQKRRYVSVSVLTSYWGLSFSSPLISSAPLSNQIW